MGMNSGDRGRTLGTSIVALGSVRLRLSGVHALCARFTLAGFVAKVQQTAGESRRSGPISGQPGG